VRERQIDPNTSSTLRSYRVWKFGRSSWNFQQGGISRGTAFAAGLMQTILSINICMIGFPSRQPARSSTIIAQVEE
jgi:hypothetical protein